MADLRILDQHAVMAPSVLIFHEEAFSEDAPRIHLLVQVHFARQTVLPCPIHGLHLAARRLVVCPVHEFFGGARLRPAVVPCHDAVEPRLSIVTVRAR